MSQNHQETVYDLFKKLREEIIPLFHKVLSDSTPSSSVPATAHPGDDTDNCSSGARSIQASDPQEEFFRGSNLCPGGKNKKSAFENGKDCCDCTLLKTSCPVIIGELGGRLLTLSLTLKEKNQKIIKDGEYIAALQQELDSLQTQLRIKEDEIQAIMITDKLTTLYNRQHLITVLEDEIARCQRYNRPVAIIMIDIDKFKDFNSKYGHQSGDQMLSYVGSLIKENTRKFDRAFRYGGEEFVIVLPESDLTMAYIVSERIRKDFEKKSFHRSVKNTSEYHDGDMSCTISAGITATFAYGTQDIGIETLIHQTETALSEAKDKGGNICIRYER